MVQFGEQFSFLFDDENFQKICCENMNSERGAVLQKQVCQVRTC